MTFDGVAETLDGVTLTAPGAVSGRLAGETAGGGLVASAAALV